MSIFTYLWLAVALGVACAAIGWLGLAGWIATAVVAASIAAHVAGNALGTKMRDATDRDLAQGMGFRGWPTAVPASDPTQLERSGGLGRLVPVSASIGGLCGAALGATALVAWTDCSWAGAVLGGVSSAVIGGLFGFLGASFVEILRTSVREAIAAERAAAANPRR